SRTRTLYRLILPQAARVAVPPLSNSFISLVKDTSLASTILVTEMFRKAQEITASSYEFLLIYCEAAAIYWVICLVLSALQNSVDRCLEMYDAKYPAAQRHRPAQGLRYEPGAQGHRLHRAFR